jgi:hypothetical protein
VQQVVKIAMSAHGLGSVYKLGDLTVKSVQAVLAVTSDKGAIATVPVPIGGVDLMISVPVGSSADPSEGRPPVTAFIAPSGGSWLAALEIAPARPGQEHRHATQPGEESEPLEVDPPPAVTACESLPPIAICDDVATATVTLRALKRRTRRERLALLLLLLAEQGQWSVLAGELRSLGVSLLIVYDPAMGLYLCVSLDRGRPPCGGIAAEYDPHRARLLIRQPAGTQLATGIRRNTGPLITNPLLSRDSTAAGRRPRT